MPAGSPPPAEDLFIIDMAWCETAHALALALSDNTAICVAMTPELGARASHARPAATTPVDSATPSTPSATPASSLNSAPSTPGSHEKFRGRSQDSSSIRPTRTPMARVPPSAQARWLCAPRDAAANAAAAARRDPDGKRARTSSTTSSASAASATSSAPTNTAPDRANGPTAPSVAASSASASSAAATSGPWPLAGARGLAYNARLGLLAVTTLRGPAHIFQLEACADASKPPRALHLRCLSPRPGSTMQEAGPGRAKGPRFSGRTSCAWSADGLALALCVNTAFNHSIRSDLTLWSAYGHRLAHLSSEPTPGELATALPQPVEDLTWAANGYQLLLLHTGQPATDDVGGEQAPHIPRSAPPPARRPALTQLRLLRSAMAATFSLCHHGNTVLMGEDRLYINPDSGGDPMLRHNVDRLCDVQWQQIQPPQTYLGANWPLRSVAIDASSQYVAVAGAHGRTGRGLVRPAVVFGSSKVFCWQYITHPTLNRLSSLSSSPRHCPL